MLYRISFENLAAFAAITSSLIHRLMRMVFIGSAFCQRKMYSKVVVVVSVYMHYTE